MRLRALTLSTIALTAGCITDYDDELGQAEEAVVGQTSIDAFNRAFDSLTAAGVALPSAEHVIDVGTCDLTDPIEPRWSDILGGSGSRWWDDFKGIYRISSYPRVGDLSSTGAIIKLRFTYLGAHGAVTAGGRVHQIAYQKDATGASVEDWNVYYTADGQLDRVRTSEDLGPISASATATQTTITLAVTRGNKVTWSVPCGLTTMRGTARLQRPVHVGTVKIGAFPIGLVYEPDWPSGERSFAKGIQENGAIMGSTFTIAVKREDSGQDFSAESSSISKAKETLPILANVLAKAPGAGTAAATVLQVLASGLGTDTQSTFYGRVDDRTASVQTVYSETERRTTNMAPGITPVGEIGLGKRDILCWMRNVTFGYVWNDGYLRMIPVAYDESRCHHAFEVRDQVARLRLRAPCIYMPPFNRPSYCTRQPWEMPGTLTELEGVVAMDPFVNNPGFRPESDPARFLGCQAMTEPSYEYMWRQSNLGTTTTGTALWQSRTVVQTPGWLSIWGIGPGMNVNTTLKTTHTTLRQTSTGTSVGSGFQIFKNGGSHSFVRCLDSAWSAAVAVLPPS